MHPAKDVIRHPAKDVIRHFQTCCTSSSPISRFQFPDNSRRSPADSPNIDGETVVKCPYSLWKSGRGYMSAEIKKTCIENVSESATPFQCHSRI